MAAYEAQHRGDHGAYDRYLRGMDASMRQKVALTAAHLLGQGAVADMGMGSGSGSQALAALYPSLRVTGVDVSAEMVRRARERFAGVENLSFVEGDIARPCFPAGSLDGVFDSSVLHHVTSFNGYDRQAAARALSVQVEQLKPLGTLIVRDFVAPSGGPVLLDLPADDGDASDDPRSCSSAALFERFARELRPLHPDPAARGFAWEPVAATAELPLAPGWRRYRLDRRDAVEFVLRKDYRRDWESEVLEEFTYFTQEEFEGAFAGLGLRVLASAPIWNPWILRNRFWGKFVLRDAAGQPEEDPATNYVIVGERVRPGEGVALREGAGRAPLGFLALEHYRRRDSGQVFDLVRRPHLTVDIVPWFVREGDVFVLCRRSYPRPILRAEERGSPSLDRARCAGYVTEPLAVLQDDKPLGQTVEEALRERVGLDGERLRSFREGARYYPSPGGLQEEVRALLVEVEPVMVERGIPNVSGFSTSGLIRAIEACQLLRAAQVGGLPNARLETNVYDLLRRLRRDPGPWIGETIDPTPAEGPPVPVADLGALEQRPPRRRFAPAAPGDSARFLELHCASFQELDAAGNVLHERALEFVLPRSLSRNTVVAAALLRQGEQVLLGLDDDDLPAAQCFSGHSQLLVAPAWRLPKHVRSLTPARAWLLERLRREHGLSCGRVWELGGAYTPSPGVTPEVVHPFAVEVQRVEEAPRPLVWVPLGQAVERLEALQDGHLRVVALRAAHALGLLTASAAGAASAPAP